MHLPAGAGAACIGNARFLDADLAELAATHGHEAAWTAAFARFGASAPTRVGGDFAVAVRDRAGRMLLAVDRFAIHTLCYRTDGHALRFARRADDLAGTESQLDPQALFEYLYFHVIPAPRTVFTKIYRVPAGHSALFEHGELSVTPWWTPVFEEDHRPSLEALREEFRAILRQAIAQQCDGGRVGCFLSGGTDSSTVAGMLGAVMDTAPATFSIGFDAQGYDEMTYARIAARHFNADHHEYYVTPDDLVRSIPDIARSFDQPFGNSSVAPVYFCAKMAKDAGIERILAGDGGDELFGGNTRYAKQRVLDAYGRVPAIVRERLLEPLLLDNRHWARVPGLKKVVSYVEQARVPMPDRLQSYNLLTRIGVADVLTPEFLAHVDPVGPLRAQRAVYSTGKAATLVNRMLAYDWKYTLSDNDLPKVTAAASLAGIAVGFPLLDDRLVDFSLRLPPSFKLKGLTLRWFFKDALRGFLPDATIAKRKHGFGLPFGVWMTQDARLKSLALDSLELLRDRGVVQPQFLDRLTNDYVAHFPGYYGEMVWILMMLGQWCAASSQRMRF